MFNIVCWYRPPTSSVNNSTFDKLKDILNKLVPTEEEIILIGATNCDFKGTNNSNTRNLKLIYSEYQFEQLFNLYTRVAVTNSNSNRSNVTRTLFDHFSMKKPNFIVKKQT